MEYIRYIIVSALILGIYTYSVEGEFTCFRKFRKKRGICGGVVKKKKFNTPEKCCARKGQGFTQETRVTLGRNKYSCVSCKVWEKSKTMTTTTSTTTTTEPLPAGWGTWGTCSTSCGAGWRSRYRQCTNCDVNHFSNVQSEPCIINYYCPVDGSWGPWHAWVSCSKSCDGGVRSRQRRCNYPPPTHGGQECEGSGRDEESCNEEPCPVDGNWGQWSRFSECSAACGRGAMSRTRTCTSPAPVNGGAPCKGSRVQNRRCEKRPCPIHGGWSAWGSWATSSVTCGMSLSTRTRQCNQPRPLFGGDGCVGSKQDVTSLDTGTLCPIDGGWSDWTEHSRCRGPPCGRGYRLRTRVCNNPRPRHRGRMCMGRSAERIPCTNEDGCPVDGGWCEFGQWSKCSATCSSMASMQVRRRVCHCPPRDHGGNYCEGSETELQECEGVPPCDNPAITVQEVPILVKDTDLAEMSAAIPAEQDSETER